VAAYRSHVIARKMKVTRLQRSISAGFTIRAESSEADMGEIRGPAAAKMLLFSLLTGTLMAERWRIIGSARAS
jgi:hypothetical protein